MQRPSPAYPGIPISSFQEPAERPLDPSLICPPEQPGNLGLLGPYRILQELGRGGVGLVYLAMRDPRMLDIASPGSLPAPPRHPTAIKVLRPELVRSPRAIERFLMEARHLQQFDHPNIVRVYELAWVAGRPYMVMAHLPGGNLAQRLRRAGIPKPELALRLTLQVASALCHAHAKGIIHRDLNPANVLLDAANNACLTDFGLARTVFNDSVSDIHREHHEGTLPYMSPAVARGEAEDTRCDIYGVGALLYELLTGCRPYHDVPAEHLRQRIIDGPPKPISTLNPLASGALARVAATAMARELWQRYALMTDLESDLRRVGLGLAPLGPHAQRETTPRPVPDIMSKNNRLLARPAPNPARAILTLALATVSLLGLGFFLVLVDDPESKENRTLRTARGPHLQASSLPAPGPLSAPTPCVADLDGDGADELVLLVPRQGRQTAPCLLCLDAGSARPQWRLPLPWQPHRIQVIDLDRDGGLELVLEGPPAVVGGAAQRLVVGAEGRLR